MAAPVPGGPRPAVVQGVGWGQALTAALRRAAWLQPGHRRVLAAGKGAGISTFGGYFQVLERSRGAMRLSPRRPEKQGSALGSGGLRGKGRKRLSASPRAHAWSSAPPLAPKNLSAQHAPARLGGYNPKWVRAAQETQPFLPLLQGWAPLSPLGCRRSPQEVRQTPEPSSYAGSRSPMQGCVLTCHGAAGTTPGSGKDRGTAGTTPGSGKDRGTAGW